jgi:GT2 family glycosyltransferase
MQTMTMPEPRRTEPRHVAVLLTVHNRREQTLACLDALLSQQGLDGLDVRVVLVDDGCTDGTAEAVRARFPEVEILRGDGSLLWSGGMREAIGYVLARPGRIDYHLWLNDDTRLEPDALARLLGCHRHLAVRGSAHSIVVGSTVDPETGALTYGGFRRIWPLPFLRRVRPSAAPQQCTTMNGNCVLVPASVVQQLGNLDPDLTHLRGDIEYGLRAWRQGVEVWLAPGTIGACAANPVGLWRDLELPLGERLASLSRPKYGIAEKNLVARRYYGPLWFLSPLAVLAYILASHAVARLLRLLGGRRGGAGATPR